MLIHQMQVPILTSLVNLVLQYTWEEGLATLAEGPCFSWHGREE
jgi:hypothetical protein